MERRRSLRAEKRIGVVPSRQRNDAHGHFLGEQKRGGSDCRLMPRRIVVEDKQGGVGDALDHPRMLFGERRALTRHRHGEAADVQTNRVDLSLADDDLAVRGLGDVRGGAVKTKEDVRLLEDGCLGRVDVFARVLLLHELPSRKRHDASLTVFHREHQPSAEAVVAPVAGSPVRRLDYARIGEFLRRKAVFLRPREDGGDAHRRIADEEVVLNLLVQFALLEIRPRRSRLLHLLETAVVELGEFGHQREEPRPLARRGVVLRLDLHAALRGQLLHRLHEGQPLLLLDELEHVARFAAPEAVVEALRHVDVETRRLLVVERTARLDARPRLFQRNAIRGDQFRQIRARPDFLDNLLAYPFHMRVLYHIYGLILEATVGIAAVSSPTLSPQSSK